ncbi:hypothetical protein Tco_1578597 [Tanacetum coccineum]
MDSMHSTLSMYYDYNAHVKGELLVMMKNSQSVNLLIFISNTLIELFNDFGFDCDGIPERPTMYLNLWSYKVVRYRYSNPMIQPEPEGSTQGYPLDSVEVLRFDTLAGNPVKEILLKLNLPDHRILKDGGEGVQDHIQDKLSQFMHAPSESYLDFALRVLRYLKGSPVIWLSNQLGDIGVKGLLPVVLYCDNSSALQIAANVVFHEKSNCIEVDVHLGLVCQMAIPSWSIKDGS